MKTREKRMLPRVGQLLYRSARDYTILIVALQVFFGTRELITPVVNSMVDNPDYAEKLALIAVFLVIVLLRDLAKGVESLFARSK